MMRIKVNGVELAYSDEGKGPPLLFIHGFPFNGRVWSNQATVFQDRYRVIVADLPGFGESEARSGILSMGSLAKDIHALIKHLNLGPVTVIGHSMGGYVALAFAKSYSAELQGLVLVSTKAGGDPPEVASARRKTAAEVQADGSGAMVDALAPKMLSASSKDPAMAASVRALMKQPRREGVIGALLGMAERPDAGPWLEHIETRTLVIAGADDCIVPASESGALMLGIPGAQLRLIAHAGHLVALEQIEAFNKALSDWLADAGGLRFKDGKAVVGSAR